MKANLVEFATVAALVPGAVAVSSAPATASTGVTPHGCSGSYADGNGVVVPCIG